MNIREMTHDELPLMWEIDRSEVIENIYYLEDGELVLKPEFYDVKGWPPGETELYMTHFEECFTRGGTFYGAFEAGELIGVAVLESKFIGSERDQLPQLQLKFLHVSKKHRGRGVGVALFAKAAVKARELGAKQLYISATPSENTINFYLNRGCVVAEEADPELFELEPEDIHLTCDLIVS
ncbi:MAG: GNAT family N-acetyltransferase [Chloroflexi bacterium]|jgi:predicted N-acetyltransferase YhbS|nr:GNAT family N-acetyltransferase [Chloroflexota bacterium]